MTASGGAAAPTSLPVLDDSAVNAVRDELAVAGVDLLMGSVVDMGGVARSKQAPVSRLGVFHRGGLGASPSWNVFCIDNTIAFTPQLNVVGDDRLRADLLAYRLIGDGAAWVPAEAFTQDGRPSPWCTRGALRRVQAAVAAQGLSARVGCEVEFVLTQADGSALRPRHWNGYGLGAALDHQAFLRDLVHVCTEAGLPVEQIHAEYSDNQWEFSLGPTDPLTAADNVVAARLLVGRVARRHGLAASFSPLPFADGGGNGAHQHVSFARDGVSLLSSGTGPHGLTGDGASLIGGIVTGLADAVGVLAGSVLSPYRLQPNHWAGAFACWGLENREAAVRFCADTAGNPHGPHVEVKCPDPAANPYLATAVILGLALDGLERGVALPPEVTRNPAELSAEQVQQTGTVRLPADQASALDALEASTLLRRLLGDEIVAAVLAVRRHEQDNYGKQEVSSLAERFRFAWSW